MKLVSQIFIDGGDPAETKMADTLLKSVGFPGVQGQTTNPSLIAKHALKTMAADISKHGKLTRVQALDYYHETVVAMAEVTSGPISIQVVAPPSASPDELLSQARDRKTWIPNGLIKFPCTTSGFEAAEIFCQEGPVNMTLCFSQEQAAAVYTATKAHNYDVFISPFVGRLDDRGENGMDVVSNILEMYRSFGDGHVHVLTASVRTLKHILYALQLKSDAITIPHKLLDDWSKAGFTLPKDGFVYDVPGLSEIPYREMSLDNDWRSYDIRHDLTDAGVAKFWEDWQSVVG